MTFEEYNKAMDAYAERIENGEDIVDDVTDFQYKYMNSVLAAYKADTKAKEICYDILEYAVNHSESGSVVQYIEDKELADSVYDIIWEELDLPENVGQTRKNKMKIIDGSKSTRDLLEMLENRVRMAPELDDKAHADLIQRVADKVNDIYKDVLETYNIGYNN